MSKKDQRATFQVINIVGFAAVALIVVGVIAYLVNPEAQATRQQTDARATTANRTTGDTTASTPATAPSTTGGATTTGATTASPPAGIGAKPTRQGDPWEYDAASNHHFNPTPGHNHWHPGPPPPEHQRGNDIPNITTSTTTPGTPPVITPTGSHAAPTRPGEPWEYDEATNHHFNPTPGHNHWHQGPPPPEGQRAGATGLPSAQPGRPLGGLHDDHREHRRPVADGPEP